MDSVNNATMSNAARKVRDGAVEFSGAAVDSAKSVADAAHAKLKDCHAQGTEVIKANPYTSVLVAFGVGAVLGVMLSRRSQ